MRPLADGCCTHGTELLNYYKALVIQMTEIIESPSVSVETKGNAEVAREVFDRIRTEVDVRMYGHRDDEGNIKDDGRFQKAIQSVHVLAAIGNTRLRSPALRARQRMHPDSELVHILQSVEGRTRPHARLTSSESWSAWLECRSTSHAEDTPSARDDRAYYKAHTMQHILAMVITASDAERHHKRIAVTQAGKRCNLAAERGDKEAHLYATLHDSDERWTSASLTQNDVYPRMIFVQ